MSAEKIAWDIYESPLGPLTVLATPAGLRAIHFEGQEPALEPGARRQMPKPAAQLDAYFEGGRHDFELPLDLRGEPLQLAIWKRLLEIPHGETTSYGELTARVDASLFPPALEDWKRVRLVGATVGLTPTPIVVPCHRVVGSDGSLVGYGGGLDRKRTLLAIESGVTTLC